MPLVDKLERIGGLLQSGTLSQEEFTQAKDHVLKTNLGETKPVIGLKAQRDALNGALARAKQEFLIERHHCMIRCRNAIKREPRASHFYVMGGVTLLWMTLGSMVTVGFNAVNPMLDILPLGTMFLGFIFTTRSVYEHGSKLIRLNAAKERWEQTQKELLQALKQLG